MNSAKGNAYEKQSIGAELSVYIPPMMGPIAVFLLAAAAGMAVEATAAPLAEISRN